MFAFRIFVLALTALVLIPSAAHFFELPGKIELGQEAYFTVQGIYAGWALFAIPIFAAILANIVLFFIHRKRCIAGNQWALISASLIVISLGIFFGWIFPGNQATANWTAQPENWEELRRNWEYGHATNAVVVLLAFLATAASIVRRD